MRKKLLMPEWPLEKPAELPPPPQGDDGPPRFVSFTLDSCPICGHGRAWRDQYLQLHCEECEPPPEPPPRQDLGARRKRWGSPRLGRRKGQAVQLRLF